MNYEEAIAIAKEQEYFPYVVIDDGIYKCVEKEHANATKTVDLVPIAEKVEIVADTSNIDTDIVQIELSYFYKGEYRTLSISRDMLNKRNFPSLMKYGIDIGDHNAEELLDFLLKQEKTAPMKYVHNSLGFGEYRNTKIFKLYNALGIQSTYIGHYDLQPKGSFEDWDVCIKNEVLGNTPMELALAIGFSAPIVAMLQDKITKDSLLVHLVGDSSKGKTTAEMLAVSPFGSPDMSKGLVKTWFATPNALLTMLDNMNGVPLAIDESSIRAHSDFTSFIYQLVQGHGKERLNKDATMRTPTSWCTTIISSGEHSLKSSCMQNTGILVRLIEISGLAFTSSAENSDKIRTCILHNYGHAGIIFAKYLMEAGTSKVYESYRHVRELMMKNASNSDSFTSRYIDKLAIILTAVVCMEEAFHYKLNFDGIMELLLKTESDSAEERDIGKRAFESFKEWFSANIDHFSMGRNASRSTNAWGKYSEKKDYMEVVVLPHFLKKMLDESGFADEKIVCEKWKAAGLLVTESGHNKIKRTVSNKFVDVRCYVLKVPKTEIVEPAEEDPPMSGFESHLKSQLQSSAEDISKMF